MPIQRDVTLSEGMTSKSFSIQANARMFMILADRLYSDKPLAVIREISSNALDAHGMIGQTKPFIISMPSDMEPMLSIRDFGPGMTHDQVMDRFTSFGDSTKSDDPNQIGGFGLGCKAPFAYADAFTVTVWQKGEKRTYAAFRGADGIPQMTHVETISGVDEPDGVEVCVPVKVEDFSRFARTAAFCLKFFPEGSFEAHGFEVDSPKYSTVKPTYRLLAEETRTHMVLLGPVAYPLDWKQVGISHDDMPLTSLVPVFEVSELDLLPSREGLSYDPRTIKTLQDRLRSIQSDLGADLYKQLSGLKKWEQIVFLHNCQQNRTLPLLRAFAAEHDVDLPDAHIQLPGRPEVVEVGAKSSRRRRRGASPSIASTEVTSDRPEEGSHEEVGIHQMNAGAVFVFNDMLDQTPTKQRANARFKQAMKDRNRDKLKIYVFDQLTPEVTDIAQVQALFDGYVNDTTRFVNLSDLPPPETIRSASTTGPKQPGIKRAVRVLTYDRNPGWYNNRRTNWADTGVEVDSGVYVPLNGYEIDGADLQKWLGTEWAKNTVIYGLTKSARAATCMDHFERIDVYVQRMQKEALADADVQDAINRLGMIGNINKDRDLKALNQLIGTRVIPGFEPLCDKLSQLNAAFDPGVMKKVSAIKDFCIKQNTKPPKAKDTLRVGLGLQRAFNKSLLLQLAVRCYHARQFDLLDPQLSDLTHQLLKRKA